MQLVNGAQFLNITFLFLLFGAAFLLFGAAGVPVLLIDICPLTSIYASL